MHSQRFTQQENSAVFLTRSKALIIVLAVLILFGCEYSELVQHNQEYEVVEAERIQHNHEYAAAEARRYSKLYRAFRDSPDYPANYLADIAADGLGPYAREDPLAEIFSIERSVDFIEGAATSWGDRYGCVTCHTNGFFLTLPPSIINNRPGYQEVQEDAREFIRSWPLPEDAHMEDAQKALEAAASNSENNTYLEDTYVVATPAFLAISELQSTGELSPEVIKALDRAWSLQEPEGHWSNWVVCNWLPFESDYHFGVTLMAIVGGLAPDSYMQTAAAQQGMQRVRRYLSENEPVNIQNRGMMLWAGRYVEGLVNEEQKEVWVQELLNLQRSDGGWASGNLGDWRQGDGAQSDPRVTIESDGYGTGFVMYVLMQAGVPTSDQAIQRGVAWLKANQRSRGHWWTQSLKNIPNTLNFLTHTGTTFALKALEAAGVVSD